MGHSNIRPFSFAPTFFGQSTDYTPHNGVSPQKKEMPMASENEAVAGNTLLTQADGDQPVANAPAQADTAPAKAELLAGKYKTPEELVTGYRNSEAAKTKAEQEAAELRRELELAKMQKTLSESIREGFSGIQSNDNSAERLRKEREELVADLRQRGEEGVVDFTANFVRTSHEKNKADLLAELKKRDVQLAELKAGLTEIKETSDSVYQANRDEIDRMVKEDGLTRGQAIKVYRKLKPQVAPALDSGGGMATRRAAASESARPVKSDAEIEAEVIELRRVVPSLTNEEADAMRARLKGVKK